MRIARTGFILLLTGFVVSCSASNGQGADQPASDAAPATEEVSGSTGFNVDAFLESPFADETIGMPPLSPDEIDEAVAWFSTPPRLSESDVPNQYDPTVTDREVQITSDGIVLYYYYASSKEDYYLQLMRIDGGPELRFGIKVGMSTEELVAVCGTPDFRSEHEGDDVVFYLGDSSFNVGFALVDGTVTAVYLSYMV